MSKWVKARRCEGGGLRAGRHSRVRVCGAVAIQARAPFRSRVVSKIEPRPRTTNAAFHKAETRDAQLMQLFNFRVFGLL